MQKEGVLPLSAEELEILEEKLFAKPKDVKRHDGESNGIMRGFFDKFKGFSRIKLFALIAAILVVGVVVFLSVRGCDGKSVRAKMVDDVIAPVSQSSDSSQVRDTVIRQVCGELIETATEEPSVVIDAQ